MIGKFLDVLLSHRTMAWASLIVGSLYILDVFPNPELRGLAFLIFFIGSLVFFGQADTEHLRDRIDRLQDRIVELERRG